MKGVQLIDPLHAQMHSHRNDIDHLHQNVHAFMTRPGAFYTLYCLQILDRVVVSFTGSYLALSQCTIIMYKFAISLIPLSEIMYIFWGFQFNGCFRRWSPDDFDESIIYCDLSDPINKNIPDREVALFGGVAMITILNVSFLCVFTHKLRQIMSGNDENNGLNNKFRNLVLKNAICSIHGSLSTIISPILWLKTHFVCWLYLDLFLNSMVIGLMQSHNQKLYECICNPCISCVRIRLLIVDSPAWQKVKSASANMRFGEQPLNVTDIDSDNDSNEEVSQFETEQLV